MLLKILFIFLISTSAFSTDKDLSQILNVSKLPPLSRDEILENFGAYLTKDGRVGYRENPSMPVPKVVNLLDAIKDMTPSLKNYMIQTSLCGERGYEAIYIPMKEIGQTLSVTYECNSACNGLYEKHEVDPITKKSKIVGISDRVPLPMIFCEALWNGGLKVQR